MLEQLNVGHSLNGPLSTNILKDGKARTWSSDDSRRLEYDCMQDGTMRGQQVAAMVQHVYPDVVPAELRHFQVMVDRQGLSERLLFIPLLV